MYRMEQKSNIAMYGGSVISFLSSILGLTTSEMLYLLIAIIGGIVGIMGYLDKHKSEKLNRKLAVERTAFDRERTRAIISFLKESPTHDVGQLREVVQKVNEVLKETEQDANVAGVAK